MSLLRTGGSTSLRLNPNPEGRRRIFSFGTCEDLEGGEPSLAPDQDLESN